MRNLAAIDDNKDLVTKEYVDGKDTPFPLDITDPDIDLSTTPSTARYDQTLRGLDANGDVIWAVDSVHDTSGAHGFQINSFGGNNQNSLQMLMKPDGTAAMWISQPAVWRSALGAAASSHNHAASNITSGVLATARGGVPTGGTTGQVLAKTSDSNNAVGWVTPSGGSIPSKDVDWTQSTYANGYYMRRGKMVSVVCESWGSITAPNNNYATVFTLPEGFRPILPTNKVMYGSCSPLGAAYPVTWKIESDGKVSVGGNGTSPNYWAFSTTFPCE